MSIVKGDSELTFQQYCDLVIQQLPTLDKKYLGKQKHSIKINYTDFQDDESDSEDDNNGDNEYDTLWET